ncbi:MAG TPA: SMC-Scp complex subunit ScpB [Candidatus Paceibacterota bacterium]|nr:SMC-Scp complex subunit ScpB [Candidatus Paceibacterota bacterium]
MPEPKQTLSETAARAQGFLLAEGGPISLKKLTQLLAVDQKALSAALEELTRSFEGSGMALVQTQSEVSLATSARVAEPLRKAFEESLSRDIGNAGLEVLAIVLYRGASTRARIDYIRGVNTASTVRLLLSRGLLERIQNPTDAREYLYRPTVELLAHLGVTAADRLPDYATIQGELAAFEKAQTGFDQHDGDVGEQTSE